MDLLALPVDTAEAADPRLHNGHRDGYKGGSATSYVGGGGASIAYDGLDAYTNYTAPGGAGTAGKGMCSASTSTYYSYGGSGGAGIFGSGGKEAQVMPTQLLTATELALVMAGVVRFGSPIKFF